MKKLLIILLLLPMVSFGENEAEDWEKEKQRMIESGWGGGWGPSEDERNKQSKIREVSNLKTQCKELGFKEGSKKFKDCVVELME